MNTVWHIRRCHMCGQITESRTEAVYECDHCGKHFSPFYYFDERMSPTPADFTIRPPSLPGQFWPIQGLSAFWEFGEID